MTLALKHSTRLSARVAGFLLCSLLAIATRPLPAAAESFAHATTDPEIEMWYYPTSTSNGAGSVRDRASTFSWIEPQEGFPNITGSGLDPARRGTFIVATNTAGTIPLLADPTRYRIDSVKVSLTILGSIGDGAGPYDNTPDDVFAILADEYDDPGHPVEMYGVGFGGSYTTFGFNGESEPQYYNSGDRRWPISGGSFSGPYQIYPIDASGRDVSNNMYEGEYSATAPGNANVAFNAAPYAVGKAYDNAGDELTPGTMIGHGTVLEFSPDLSNPGVVAYLQNSLAAGHLGFFFSSLHQPAGHDGTIFYPDFYLDNNPSGPNPYGAGPTVDIQVTILDAALAGDYDSSGGVDGNDFLAWQRQFGSAVSPAGSGADGNGNGVVDAADLDLWKAQMAAGAPPAVGAVAGVPEPHTATLLLAASAAVIGARRRFARRRCGR